MSRIQLPRIGTIAGINEDGSYRQGPIPGLGGPFETATEFFRAWSAKVEFGLSQDQLKEAAGPFADELSASALSFKKLVNDLAGGLSIRNEGPFPLCHGDFGLVMTFWTFCYLIEKLHYIRGITQIMSHCKDRSTSKNKVVLTCSTKED